MNFEGQYRSNKTLRIKLLFLPSLDERISDHVDPVESSIVNNSALEKMYTMEAVRFNRLCF